MIDLLDRLEAAAKEATPGPWRVNTAGTNGKIDEVYVYAPGDHDDVAIAADIADPATGQMSEANAAFIAACDPTTILRLVRVARAAQRVDDDMREWNGVPSDAAARELRAALSELDPLADLVARITPENQHSLDE
jgi:hypothetical protein